MRYLLAILLSVFTAGAASNWYINPVALGTGDGTSPENAAGMYALNFFETTGNYRYADSTTNTALVGPFTVPNETLTGVQPGDTIFLLDGHYYFSERRNSSGVALAGHRVAKPAYRGTYDNWITIKSLNQWGAVIDGALQFQSPFGGGGGSTFVIVQDIMFVNSDIQRVVLQGNYERPSIRSDGSIIKFRNNIMANQGGTGGIGFYSVSPTAPGHSGLTDAQMDTELYGNIVFGAGGYETNTTSYVFPNAWIRGGGSYNQNDLGTRTIKHNISFAHNTTGMKVFGVNGPVKDTDFIENTFFYCGTLGVNGSGTGIGGRLTELLHAGTDEQVPENITIDGNILWNWDIDTQGNGVVVQWNRSGRNYRVVNNEIYHGRAMFGGISTDGIILTNNTLFISGGEFVYRDLKWTTAHNPSNLFDYNQYFGWAKQSGVNGGRQGFYYQGSPGGTYTNYSFSNWQAALADVGWDANSTFQAGSPTYLRVTTHENVYDSGRRDVIVRNFTGASTVQWNPGDHGIEAGANITVRDAQNIVSMSGSGTNWTYSLNAMQTITNWDGTTPITLDLTSTNYVPIRAEELVLVDWQKIAEHTNVRKERQFNVFVIQASGTDGGGPTTPAITINATDDSASETGPGTATIVFTATPAPASSLPVNISFSGTASAGDYTTSPDISGGVVTFPAGQSTVTVTVTPIDDATTEGTETLTVTVDSGTGYTVGSPASDDITILDADPTAVITAELVQNGTEGSAYLEFRAVRTATSGAATVSFSLSGSAVAGVDYVAPVSFQLIFEDGSATSLLSIEPINDEIAELTESLTFTLTGVVSGSGSIGSPSSAEGFIIDDDAVDSYGVLVTTVISPAAEGSTGEIRFNRNGTEGDVTIYFRLSSTTTASASDWTYNTTLGVPVTDEGGGIYSITIPDTANFASVVFDITDDSDMEPREVIGFTIIADQSGGDLYFPDEQFNRAFVVIPASDFGSSTATADSATATEVIVE